MASDAVETGIVQLLRGQMFGLKPQVRFGPVPGHNDCRADGAQLGRDRFGDLRRARRLVLLSLFTRSPDDRVMRRLCAGDVDFVHPVMGTQIPADPSPAVHDAQGIAVDQRLQNRAQERGQVIVHRVHLEDDDLVLRKRLLEHVQRCDRSDIASPENKRNSTLPRCGRDVISRGGVGGQRFLGHAGLHPDIGGDTGQKKLIPDPVRHDPHDKLTIGGPARFQTLEKGFPFHARKRLHQSVAGPHDRIGAGHPFLSGQWRPRRDQLAAGGGFRPAFGHIHQAILDLLQHRDPFGGRCPCPSGLPRTQRGKVAIKRGMIGG